MRARAVAVGDALAAELGRHDTSSAIRGPRGALTAGDLTAERSRTWSTGHAIRCRRSLASASRRRMRVGAAPSPAPHGVPRDLLHHTRSMLRLGAGRAAHFGGQTSASQ